MVQIGFLVLKAFEGSLIIPILVGLTIPINLFLMASKNRTYKQQTLLTIFLMGLTYTLGAIDLRERVLVNNAVISKTNGIFIFFEGYLLALLQQLFLRYFLQFSYLFVFDIAALVLRCFIFVPEMFQGDIPYPLFIQIFFDFVILHVIFLKEKTDRNNFEQLYKQKEDLMKFKSLMVDSVPESIVIINSSLDAELFTNKAYRKIFRNSLSDGNFKKDLDNIFLMKESLEDVDIPWNLKIFLQESPKVSVSQFLQQGIISKLFDEKAFVLQATSTSDNPETPLGRQIFELKIVRLDWDSEEALTVILNDITHRETIIALKISELNKEKVLSSVSHELKTPLNAILGAIQIIQQQTEDLTILENCKMCRNSTDLLIYYINSILDLQLLRKNKLKLRIKLLHIRDLAKELEELFIDQCKKKGIGLDVSIGEDVPETINSDKPRLTQILVHLVSNAVKFTFRGKITIEIKIDPQDHNLLCFSVKDSGIGIHETEKKRLFKTYGRIESSSVGTQGAGLGLSISNDLVLKLGGKGNTQGIYFESQQSLGSVFSFTLPFDYLERNQTNCFSSRKLITETTKQVKPDEDDKVFIFVNGTTFTEQETLMNRFGREPRNQKIISQESQDTEEFQGLGNFGKTGDELFIDEDLRDFLSRNGLTLKEKVHRYKTKTRDNFLQSKEVDSKKELDDEIPLKNSIIRVPLGASIDSSTTGSLLSPDKARRKNTGLPYRERSDFFFEPMKTEVKSPTHLSDAGNDSFRPLITRLESDACIPRNELPKPISIKKIPNFNRGIKASSPPPLKAILNEINEVEPPAEKILVVDDNPYNLIVAQQLIQKQGYRIETAIGGQQAIELIRASTKDQFRLILMDLQMPVMDGFETTQSLINMMKKNEIPDTPIIALTANDSEENIQRCLKYGMKDCLSKPLKIKDIVKFQRYIPLQQ